MCIFLEKIEREDFDCFHVYKMQNNFSFLHVEIEDTPIFYEKMFNYFFDDGKLLKYCENTSSISFTPSKRNYVTLFKHLKTYIDSENLAKDVSNLDEELRAVLCEEMQLEDKDGKTIVRLDKMGKIGEYIFCCLLSDYFHFDCILPKVHLQTDYNMNVYGIDTLYYSQDDNLLLFGESKLCLKLNNGIGLINASLKEYEQQLEDEFLLVLSNRIYKDKLKQFDKKYGDVAELCMSIQDFIDDAGITQIGIPIFIAHGTDLDEKKIFKKLKNIKSKNMFGIDTKYYLISLPMINKNKLIATFTELIRGREEFYESIAK